MAEDEGQMGYGHKPASEEYLLRATENIAVEHPEAFFVIFSNNQEYCRRLFRGERMIFMETGVPAKDLALLTLMDHLILTVGSYGWWCKF